ncbi:WD40 repeat domain-containing protein [Endozoicomonas arenosclerae]|uniref:WD40 repeat domain-containing protein n=1 Tax=Endozoicomonas arenosclerae TaxID=1633495 RepID=UPI000AA6339F|nr:hypothetical protein [Endozoicomonas arenosclerae]
MFRSILWIQVFLISIGISFCAQAQDTLVPIVTFAHGAQINDIAYNQQGNCVATVGENFRGKFWNVDRSVNFSAPESRNSIATIRHNARIGQVIFSENYAATASDDDLAKLWAQTGILVNALGVPALALKAIANSRNGQDATRVAIDSTEKYMVVGTAKGEAQLLDLSDIKVRSRVPDANYGQYEADYVYEAEPDNPNFNNIETGIEEPALIARMWHKGSIADMVFSPKDKWVATLSEDMTVKVWNYDKNPEPSDNGRLQGNCINSERLSKAAFSGAYGPTLLASGDS